MGNRENGKQHTLDKSTRYSHQLNPFVLATPFAAVVLLQLVGRLFPGSSTWGFSYWSLIDGAVVACVFVGAIILLIPSVAKATSKAFGRVKPVGGIFRRLGWPVLVVLISVGMATVLFYFRSKALIYGDGYTVVSDTADLPSVVLHHQLYFQSLSVYFHYYFFHLIDGFGSLTSEEIYALINVVGGTVGLWAIFRISGQLTTDRVTRAFILLGALTGSSVILFFGYVENYTWATSMSLWVISFAIQYAGTKRGMAGLVICSALAFLFHMITLPFVIVALMALFIRTEPGGNYLFGIRLTTINSVFVLGSIVFVAVSQLVDVPVFVPLLPTSAHSYWFLSGGHLIDVLNQLMLVAAPGVALWILTVIYSRKQAFAVGPEDGLLGTAALLAFLAAFWIDPGIGAPRDWDLLSFYGFPLTLWALLRFIKLFPKRKVSSQWIVAVVVVIIVHLGANLYEKRHPDIAVSRLDNLLSGDVHYQAGYDISRRCLTWATVLQVEANRSDLAIKYLKRRLEAFSDSYQCCFNLGDIYYRDGQYDSATKYVAMGLEIKPDEMRFLLNIAKMERHRQRHASGAAWAARAVGVDPNNVEALTELGIGLSNVGENEEALPHFRKAYCLAPDSLNQIVNLGFCYALTGSTDSAFYYVSRALPRAPDRSKVELYCCVISAALDIGKTAKAADYLRELRRIAPASPEIPGFTARLAKADEN